MGYEFTSDEPVAEGVTRIVREEALRSAERLKVKKVRERDDAIHEVRKSVKRVRGLLKLMQPALGDAYYEEERAWRELGRKLSALRDAGAIQGAFNELRASCPRRLYGPIRRRLAVNKHEVSKDVGTILARVAAGLKSAETRLKAWHVEGQGAATIAPGLKRTYRQGARALRAAEADPTPDNLHELRKRAKEHLYQVRLLQGLWDGSLQRHEANARRLEETLGSHQNLTVLKTTILEQPAGLGKTEDVEKFLQVLDRIQRDLAARALKLAARVYREPSTEVTKRVKQLWEKWAS